MFNSDACCLGSISTRCLRDIVIDHLLLVCRNGSERVGMYSLVDVRDIGQRIPLAWIVAELSARRLRIISERHYGISDTHPVSEQV